MRPQYVCKIISQTVLKTTGWNLQFMIKQIKLFGNVQNFVFCPYPCAIYLYKTL